MEVGAILQKINRILSFTIPVSLVQIVSLVILAIWSLSVWQASAAESPKRWYSSSFTKTNSDIPDNDVGAVVATPDGAVWVGTSGGLARFTDNQWQVFTKANSDIPDNGVNALLATSDGAVWVGTAGGLARFTDNQWQVFTEANSDLPGNTVRALVATGDGAVWAGTTGGLARFADGQWQVFTKANSDIPDNGVNALAATSKGAVWVGTYGGGVARFTDNQWQVFTKASSDIPGNDVRSLVALSDGTVWVGTTGGLARFADDHWQAFTETNSDIPNNHVRALVAVPDGAVWVGTSSGLARFADNQWQSFTKANNDFPDDNIRALFSMPDGALWVGTHAGGLTRFADDGQWQVFTDTNSDLPDNSVRALVSTADDAVWAGTSGGLALFSDGQWQVFTKANSDIPNNDVRALVATPDGAMWVGTSGGLARFADGQWQVFTHANSGLPYDRVTALVATPDGALWVGTMRGLARFTDNQWRVFTDANSDLPGNTVQALVATADGAVWVGMFAGLARFTDNQWQVFTKANSGLLYNRVPALAATADGAVWAGTNGGGLARFTDNQWQVFTKTGSDIADNYVRALAAAADGAVWAGTNGGLARFADNQWQVFTVDNSHLPDNEVLALDVTADGAVWAGTNGGGLARFHPPKLRPQVGSLVGTVNGPGNADIRQNQHAFAVVANDPSYHTRAADIRYEWTLHRLLPTGDELVASRTSRSAVFPAAFDNKDGDYRISVRAIDVYGFRSEPFSYAFKVDIAKPDPLRETIYLWGGRIFATGFILATVYLLFLYPMLWLYPSHRWARALIDSGVATKFPIAHKLILNSRWARRKLFQSHTVKHEKDATVPELYIPQGICQRGAPIDDACWLDSSVAALEPLLDAPGQLLILGRSGTGKSVLVQFLLRETARHYIAGNSNLVPLHIDLRRQPLTGQPIEQLMRETLADGNVELPNKTLDHLIEKGGFLLLVDSLSEFPADKIRDVVQPFLNRNANNKVLLFSEYDMLKRMDMPVHVLCDVSQRQAETYLKNYTGKSNAWSSLPDAAKALTKNPQDLAVIAQTVFDLGDSQKVPTRRAALYRQILNQDKTLSFWASSDAMQLGAIYAVSFRMFSEKQTPTNARAGQWVRQAIQAESGEPTSDTVVDECLDALHNCGMFTRESEKDAPGKRQPLISVSHALIGKYLAACHISRLLQKDDKDECTTLFDQIDNDTWLDVLGFVVDELNSKEELSKFVEALIERGPGVTMKAAGYALFNKPDLIKKTIKDLYASRRIKEDAQQILPVVA